MKECNSGKASKELDLSKALNQYLDKEYPTDVKEEAQVGELEDVRTVERVN